MADSLQEVLCLARLYLKEDEIGRLVTWIAHRLGRNQAMAGDRPEIQRLEHVARHWLSEEERESLARWMLMQAGRRGPIVPERSMGGPERRKG